MFEKEQAAKGGKGEDRIASVLPIPVHLVLPGPRCPLGPIRYGKLRSGDFPGGSESKVKVI
jgi:hypothetical protein